MYFEMLEGILKDAVSKRELKKDTSVELLTHIIICELYGMMTCWCMSDGKFEPLDWTDRFYQAQIKTMFEPYLN